MKVTLTDLGGSYVFNPSAKTITLSWLPRTINTNQLLLINNTTTNTIIYQFNNPALWGSISSNVISLTYDTTAMSSWDSLVIFLDIPTPWYDLSTNTFMHSNMNPAYSRYTDAETLVTAQDLTASYADFWAEIDMTGYNTLWIFVTYDVNDSENVTLKALAKYESAWTIEAEFDNNTKSIWTTSASDGSKYFEIEVGAIPFIQLQAIAGTLWATAWDLTISIVKKY